MLFIFLHFSPKILLHVSLYSYSWVLYMPINIILNVNKQQTNLAEALDPKNNKRKKFKERITSYRYMCIFLQPPKKLIKKKSSSSSSIIIKINITEK